MAGIGFPLLKMYEANNLGSRIQAVGHAMFVASGPSLMTILCFVLITILTGGRATASIVGFRVAIVYAFALAFIIAAPISLVAVRIVSDAFSKRDFSTLRGVYCVAIGLAGGVAALIGAAVFGIYSDWRPAFWIPCAALSALVCALFVAASFATAMREFKAVTGAFALGAIVACILVVSAIQMRLPTGVIITGFHVGFLLALFGITVPLFDTFPDAQRTLAAFTRDLAAGFVRHRVLAIGGLLGALAIWVDKFLLWQLGVSTAQGLSHLPRYDSSIFIAYLLILPGLSMFLVLSETELFKGFRRYQSAIDGRGTLRQIDSQLGEIGAKVTGLVFRLTLIQFFVALIASLAAPILIEIFGLAYSQLQVMRFLIIASAFQFAFLACSAVILFIGDVRSYALLQLAFFVLNAGLTLIVLLVAPDRLGFGYLAACAGAAILAFSAQARAIANLNADILARA